MKISVFNCPGGVTGEGILQAFLDAGLPRAYLKKKLNQKIRRYFPSPQPSPRLAGRGKGEGEAVSGIAIALQYFKIKKCFVRNLGIGRKGDPRTLKLLRGFILNRIPIHREIVTREGARILAKICEKDDAIPAMRLEQVGFGPNQLMVSMGETVAPFRRERVLLLETNIDDMSPQVFELLYERLFKAGALDVWVQPILMKKMRPAFKLSILLKHSEREKISEVLFRETPTLGVRFLELDRFSLPRKRIRVKTRFGPVRVKVVQFDSQYSSLNPEYKDLKRIAKRKNLPFQTVWAGVKKDLE